jgi:hypothetical protein
LKEEKGKVKAKLKLYAFMNLLYFKGYSLNILVSETPDSVNRNGDSACMLYPSIPDARTFP